MSGARWLLPVICAAIVGEVLVVCAAAAEVSGDALELRLPCALNAVDVTTVPTTPPRLSPWVYDLDCGQGTPDRLNPALTIGREIDPAPIRATTTFDTASAGAGEILTLYQLDCSCSDDILIVKSRTVGELVLY